MPSHKKPSLLIPGYNVQLLGKLGFKSVKKAEHILKYVSIFLLI